MPQFRVVGSNVANAVLMAIVQITGTRWQVGGGAGPPDRVLGSDPNRVFVIVNIRTFVGNGMLGYDASGMFGTDILTGIIAGNFRFRRRDYGELVTNEWYLSDGSGAKANCDLTIIEGTEV